MKTKNSLETMFCKRKILKNSHLSLTKLNSSSFSTLKFLLVSMFYSIIYVAKYISQCKVVFEKKKYYNSAMLTINLFLIKFKGLGLSPAMAFIDIVTVEWIKDHSLPS